MTRASTSSGWYLHQLGGRLLTGLVEWDLPFSCFGILYPFKFCMSEVRRYLRIKFPLTIGINLNNSLKILLEGFYTIQQTSESLALWEYLFFSTMLISAKVLSLLLA
jgi:hypothetical protein